MNTWFIGCFSKKIKLSLSQKRLFVSWICWCCNYAFFLSRMLHLRAFLSRMSWLRAFWRWILRRIFGRNPQKYAEFWQKICGKSWPLEPLEKAPWWPNMAYNHVLCPCKMFKGHFGSCRDILGHEGIFWVMKFLHRTAILGHEWPFLIMKGHYGAVLGHFWAPMGICKGPRVV